MLAHFSVGYGSVLKIVTEKESCKEFFVTFAGAPFSAMRDAAVEFLPLERWSARCLTKKAIYL